MPHARVVGQAGTRRWRVLGVVATLLALLLWLWVDAGHPVWRVPGRTAGELRRSTGTAPRRELFEGAGLDVQQILNGGR